MDNYYKPINYKRAMEITDNDISLFESMMEAFLQTCSEYTSDIKTAVSNRNSKELRFFAHRAKSGLSSIGATAAAEFALKMEQMGESSIFYNIDEIFKVFENEIILIESYAKNKKWLEEG